LRDNLAHGLSNLTVKAIYYGVGSGSTQLVTTTDASGHFSFSGEAGSWNVEVAPDELNALGYLSVSSQYLDVSGNTAIRLTTRRLDFTHRIAGHLADEAGLPLAGYSLRARITENNAVFETNVVTGPNGSFLLAATPAVWSFHGLEPPAGTNAVQVFGEELVEVELTNSESQATFTAPKATSTISLTTTNLGGWDVVVQTEAFGATYRLVKPVPLWAESPLAIQVFNGVWQVSVTNSQPNVIYPQRTPAPSPLLVALTNEIVPVTLATTSPPSPNQLLQRVRTVTETGAVVTNATVFAISDSAFLNPPPSPGPFGTPGTFDLGLDAGRWTIYASTREYPDWTGWEVARQFDITTNVPLPEITFVFPEPGVGPRLFGTLTASGEAPAGSAYVYLRMTVGGTNYSISVLTDALGQFGTNVPPGRWEVQTYATCWISSIVVVSNQDVEVNLEYSVPVNGTPVPVDLSAVDEEGVPLTDAWLNLSSGLDFGFPGTPITSPIDLRPGIWTASLSANFNFNGATPTYLLHPSSTWQLSPGVTATNLVLVSRRTPARIEGRLRDEEGRLLLSGYAVAWTSVQGTNFWSYGAIDSGYFSLNVFAGEWLVGAAVSGYPDLGAFPGIAAGALPIRRAHAVIPYTKPASRFVRVTNDVVRCEFSVTNIPEVVTLTVTVLREDGSPMEGMSIFTSDAVDSQARSADSNGMATFLTIPGQHWISAYSSFDDFNFDPLFWPSLRTDFQAPSNHVLLVVRQPAGCIPGTISNAPSLGLQPQVVASTDVNGTNYSIGACPDTSGHYCVPAFPGAWTVELDLGTLFGYGIQTVAAREVIVPPTGAPPRADFSLTPIAGDFRIARLSAPVLLADGRLRLELEGQAPLTWRIERSENLRDWTLVAIQSTGYRSLVIEEPPEPSRRAAFYRAVWVR
jgi:hypothetical protein